MTDNDVAQKLARLPEGLAERNLQSWNDANTYFVQPYDAMMYEHFLYIFEVHQVVLAFLQSEQAKLFRAEGGSPNILIISTTDGQVKIGEPYLSVYIDRGFLTARYGVDEKRQKYNLHKKISDNRQFRTGNDAITFLQPVLDLL